MATWPDKTASNAIPDSLLFVKLVRTDEAQLRAWWQQSGAERWSLSLESFASELARCINGNFHAVVPSYEQARSHIGTLHLEDLALACACAVGRAEAWEHFVKVYRPYLRACTAAMLRRPASAPEAQELADSLFADLYGLSAEKRGRLFRYFHGRSSLKTWLRAVLAQRHIDKVRAERRFEELPEDHRAETTVSPGPMTKGPMAPSAAFAPLQDPHRDSYLRLFAAALTRALRQLDSRDTQRLSLYYAEGKKLAEIAREFGEHESSASRHLERIRRALRGAVEEILRAGAGFADGPAARSGMSEAQIALCFEYASHDAPIDFGTLFSQREEKQRGPGGSSL